MQTGIQYDLQQRLGYTAEDASKVTVNLQNGHEIRINDASGNQVSDLNLSPVSIGSPNAISQKYLSGSLVDLATTPPGKLLMQIGMTQVDLDVSKLDTSNINNYAQDLKIALQNQLLAQGWSTSEIRQLDIKASTTDPTSLVVTDTGGHFISQMDFVTASTTPGGDDTVVSGFGLLE
jgi:hypothetical protein